jgi:hypothetical protein
MFGKYNFAHNQVHICMLCYILPPHHKKILSSFTLNSKAILSFHIYAFSISSELGGGLQIHTHCCPFNVSDMINHSCVYEGSVDPFTIKGNDHAYSFHLFGISMIQCLCSSRKGLRKSQGKQWNPAEILLDENLILSNTGVVWAYKKNKRHICISEQKIKLK